jgi:hypothetical protein
MTERYYQGLKEIKRAKTEDEANALIKQGWELVKPAEVSSGPEFGAKVHYVMGLFGVATPATPAKPPSDVVSDEGKLLESLEWQESEYGGEWIHKENIGGAIAKVFDSRSEYFIINGFEYHRTKTGNIQRKKVKQ